MTNAAIKSIMDQNGKKVRMLKSTTNRIVLNDPESPYPIQNSDISFVTINGDEMLKIKRWNPAARKSFYTYWYSAPIETILVTEDENDRLDPTMVHF